MRNFAQTQLKLKVQMISFYTVILNKKLRIIQTLPNSDDFVCQIESGLTKSTVTYF